MTLMLVQMTIARREVNRTNQVQTKINSERSSNFYYTLNPWQHKSLNIKSNEIFFKNYILVETLQKPAFARVSCKTCSENFINFPEHSQ